MSDRSFYSNLIDTFLLGGTYIAFLYTTCYLIDKTIQHDDEIKELFSRLEKCEKNHESSQDSN